MGEAERRNSKINGVMNVGINSGTMNLQAYKDDLINKYEKTPDEFGKTFTIEFDETKNTDTNEHYVNYWVY